MSCIAIKKICKVHGKLTILNSIIRVYSRYKKYNFIIVCRDCSKESEQKYYKKNKEERKKAGIEWFRKNKEKVKIIRYKTRQKNKIKQNEESKIKYINHKNQLSDRYVKMLLSKKNVLKYKNVPKELVELKRITLKIKRLIKEKENG